MDTLAQPIRHTSKLWGLLVAGIAVLMLIAVGVTRER